MIKNITKKNKLSPFLCRIHQYEIFLDSIKKGGFILNNGFKYKIIDRLLSNLTVYKEIEKKLLTCKKIAA